MKLLDFKLTQEEDSKLDSLIGKAIRKNARFPLLKNRVGVSETVTIQDIYNSNPDTIRDMGKSLNKLINDNDPEFSVGKPELSYNGISAVELKEALKLILKEKDYKAKLKIATAKKRALLEEKETLLTPVEKRKAIDKELEALEEVDLAEVEVSA